jgi:hypothetical protein
MTTAACYILHDDCTSLSSSILGFEGLFSVFVLIGRVPWHGTPGDWPETARIAEAAGAEVILGEWTSELEHRQAAIAHLLERGFTHALIPDGDEVIEPKLLETLLKVAEAGIADRVYVEWDTYWKSPEYAIRPRERFTRASTSS